MEQIYKYRSFSASIASGYKLFRSNIRTILAKSWIEALAMGITFGLLLVGCYKASALGICLAAVAFVVALVFWIERLFVLIDGGTLKDKLWRAAVTTVVGVLFLTLPLIGAPLINVMMEIMLEEHPKPLKALATGFKHWGYLFLMLLMSGMIMAILIAVICIPLNISIYGLIVDHIGTVAGDPSGLPSTFPIILFFVGTLTMFVMVFVQIWQTYAIAYSHGAILTRDNRK